MIPLHQHGAVDLDRVCSEKLGTSRRDPEGAPSSGIDQTSLLEVGLCPADPVVKHRCGTTGKHRGPLVIGQLEPGGQLLDCVAEAVLIAVCSQGQERQHQGLIVGNGHRERGRWECAYGFNICCMSRMLSELPALTMGEGAAPRQRSGNDRLRWHLYQFSHFSKPLG